MNVQQFKRVLDDLEAKRVPSDLDLWPRLQMHLVAHPRGVGWRRWFPAISLGWVTLALVAILAIGATVHATTPTLSRLIRLFEPEMVRQGDPASLGQQLNLSQTIDNVTVSVDWAFADTHRIMIGYVMRSDDGRRFDPYHVKLVDETGVLLPFSMGYGVTGKSELLDVTLPPGESNYVAVFANEIQESAPGKILNLRLEMQAEELILPTPLPTLSGNPTASPAGPESMLLEPLPVGKRLGPFTFEFSVSVVDKSQ